jgi:hypothetical protein
MTASCRDSRLLSYDSLQATFVVSYKPTARASEKTPIIVDVFTVLLLNAGHGADHIENTSSVVRIVA